MFNLWFDQNIYRKYDKSFSNKNANVNRLIQSVKRHKIPKISSSFQNVFTNTLNNDGHACSVCSARQTLKLIAFIH